MNERLEMEISALLDDELSHEHVLALVDHLVDHEEGRAFYRRTRSLGRALSDGELPDDMWSRIEAAARERRLGDRRRARRVHWGFKLAALVLCTVGIWSVGRFVVPQPDAGTATRSVLVAGNAGAMSDDRFIELTTELLRADRRYHEKMGEIMSAVNSTAFVFEGSAEGRRPLIDHRGIQRAAFSNDDGAAERAPVWD